jgi:hypothetical protein
MLKSWLKYLGFLVFINKPSVFLILINLISITETSQTGNIKKGVIFPEHSNYLFEPVKLLAVL